MKLILSPLRYFTIKNILLGLLSILTVRLILYLTNDYLILKIGELFANDNDFLHVLLPVYYSVLGFFLRLGLKGIIEIIYESFQPL